MLFGLVVVLCLALLLQTLIALNIFNVQQLKVVSVAFLIIFLIELIILTTIVLIFNVLQLREPYFLPFIILLYLRENGQLTAKELKAGIEKQYNVRLTQGAFNFYLIRTIKNCLVVNFWTWRESNLKLERVHLLAITKFGLEFLEKFDPILSKIDLINGRIYLQ